MRVDVYWNLHKGGYSIRAREGADKGRVIGYAARVDLVDATFTVREGARQRVLHDKQKSVHAWVTGTLVDSVDASCMTAVTYNPYREATFVRRDTRSPVHSAQRVAMETRDGRAFVSADL
jgi:hypothetical protein